MKRKKQTVPKATTWKDLMLHLYHDDISQDDIGMNDTAYESIPASQMRVGMTEVCQLTPVAKNIQAKLDQASQNLKGYGGQNAMRLDTVREGLRKQLNEQWKSFQEDPRVSDADLEDISEQLASVFAQAREKVNCRFGKNGGGGKFNGASRPRGGLSFAGKENMLRSDAAIEVFHLWLSCGCTYSHLLG